MPIEPNQAAEIRSGNWQKSAAEISSGNQRKYETLIYPDPNSYKFFPSKFLFVNLFRAVLYELFCTFGFIHEQLTKSPVEYWFIFRLAKVFIHLQMLLMKSWLKMVIKNGEKFLIGCWDLSRHFLSRMGGRGNVGVESEQRNFVIMPKLL